MALDTARASASGPSDHSNTTTPDSRIHITLTSAPLSATSVLSAVRSPSCGATVLFAGTTRDSFGDKPVVHLAYTAYAPLATRTMHTIGTEVLARFPQVQHVAIAHRLGVVPVGEESVLVAVSSPHRTEAWRAGEEVLELVKARVEIWKLEEFGGKEGGVWRANRDGKEGVRVGDGGVGVEGFEKAVEGGDARR